MNPFTDRDLRHIEETVAGLNQPDCDNSEGTPCGEPARECKYPDCDCFSSEIIMTSIGDAEVYQDGGVRGHGYVLNEGEE